MQWRAFKSNLDQNLTEIDLAQYQGSALTSISNYALGYQLLKDSDPRTAADYADKAIGLLKAGLNDYQKGGWSAFQYLAETTRPRPSYSLTRISSPRRSRYIYQMWILSP